MPTWTNFTGGGSSDRGPAAQRGRLALSWRSGWGPSGLRRQLFSFTPALPVTPCPPLSLSPAQQNSQQVPEISLNVPRPQRLVKCFSVCTTESKLLNRSEKSVPVPTPHICPQFPWSCWPGLRGQAELWPLGLHGRTGAGHPLPRPGAPLTFRSRCAILQL